MLYLTKLYEILAPTRSFYLLSGKLPLILLEFTFKYD